MTTAYRILVDRTMALLVVGPERVPVRTLEELRRATAVAVRTLSVDDRASACCALADAYTRHIQLAAEALLAALADPHDTDGVTR